MWAPCGPATHKIKYHTLGGISNDMYVPSTGTAEKNDLRGNYLSWANQAMSWGMNGLSRWRELYTQRNRITQCGITGVLKSEKGRVGRYPQRTGIKWAFLVGHVQSLESSSTVDGEPPSLLSQGQTWHLLHHFGGRMGKGEEMSERAGEPAHSLAPAANRLCLRHDFSHWVPLYVNKFTNPNQSHGQHLHVRK